MYESVFKLINEKSSFFIFDKFNLVQEDQLRSAEIFCENHVTKNPEKYMWTIHGLNCDNCYGVIEKMYFLNSKKIFNDRLRYLYDRSFFFNKLFEKVKYEYDNDNDNNNGGLTINFSEKSSYENKTENKRNTEKNEKDSTTDYYFTQKNKFLKTYDSFFKNKKIFTNLIFSNNEENSRLSKNFLGKKKVFFLIKKDINKINFLEKNFLFKLRFNDNNSNFNNNNEKIIIKIEIIVKLSTLKNLFILNNTMHLSFTLKKN